MRRTTWPSQALCSAHLALQPRAWPTLAREIVAAPSLLGWNQSWAMQRNSFIARLTKLLVPIYARGLHGGGTLCDCWCYLAAVWVIPRARPRVKHFAGSWLAIGFLRWSAGAMAVERPNFQEFMRASLRGLMLVFLCLVTFGFTCFHLRAPVPWCCEGAGPRAEAPKLAARFRTTGKHNKKLHYESLKQQDHISI